MRYQERYWHHLKRLWLVVVLAAIAMGAASFVVGSVTPGPYRATATLLVNVTETSDTIDFEDLRASDRLANTLEELMPARPVLDAVATRLGGPETADELAESINVSSEDETQLVRVAAEGDDANRAALIANTLVEVFFDGPSFQPAGVQPGTVSIVESALPPEALEGPSLLLRTVLGVLAGLSLGLILVVGATYFDEAVWEPEDLRSRLPDLRPLGVIPRAATNGDLRGGQGQQLPLLNGRYRALAATVLSTMRKAEARRNGCVKLAVFSGDRKEGRTNVIARLGMALAADGHRVTLVDFDLREPTLHQEFHLSNDEGISDWLSAPAATGSKHDILQGTALPNLTVVTCGKNASLPTLTTEQVRIAIGQLGLGWRRSEAPELILFDTPPLADGMEALVLAQLVDGAIIVVEAKRTPVDLATSVAAQLETVGLPVLGYVLNKR